MTIIRSYRDGGDSPIHYVATNGTHTWPYTNWVGGATNIQDAVETAVAGDTVLVTNGTYGSSGAEVHSMSNRVALTRSIALQSVNGPNHTFIVGAADPVSTNGPAAVRCAYVTNGAVIAGFTLTNGHTHAFGAWDLQQSGGGIFLDGGGMVSNCTISGNSAVYYGGGVYFLFGGTLKKCLLSDNSVDWYGGGVFFVSGGVMDNCLLVDNSADYGGGVYCYYGGSLNNCTLSDNSADVDAGGAYFDYGGTLINCILWGNAADNDGANWDTLGSGALFTNICTTTIIGNNRVTNDPLFAGGGDYRLSTHSPCIDAAIPLAWITDDIEGTPRPLDGNGSGTALPDIGAYEFSSAVYNTDGDPHTDYEEYIADTDATDSNHWLRITGFSVDGSATVWFDPASESRQYSLLYSTNLVEGLWTAVDGQVDIPGSGGTNSLLHTNRFPAAFYQVEVEMVE